MNLFNEKVGMATGSPLKKGQIDILQVNLGKLCNLSCVHCHVEAGPTRTKENMDEKTAEAVLRFLEYSGIKTLDLTGGAPEMNPNFKTLVAQAKRMGVHVIDRCNLTVFSVIENLPRFMKGHQVEIIASLPCYSRENVDKQRGEGTFSASIDALLELNALGYGMPDSGLSLHLMYNPVEPHLPPPQADLEKDYKERLFQDFGVVFNRLYALTNMPIKRYARYLRTSGRLESYEMLLIESFNASTLQNLMCLNTLSVGWDGRLYDCDFNQMMGMQMQMEVPLTVFNATLDMLCGAPIMTAGHCFGCTAGAGSSCQGTLS